MKSKYTLISQQRDLVGDNIYFYCTVFPRNVNGTWHHVPKADGAESDEGEIEAVQEAPFSFSEGESQVVTFEDGEDDRRDWHEDHKEDKKEPNSFEKHSPQTVLSFRCIVVVVVVPINILPHLVLEPCHLFGEERGERSDKDGIEGNPEEGIEDAVHPTVQSGWRLVAVACKWEKELTKSVPKPGEGKGMNELVRCLPMVVTAVKAKKKELSLSHLTQISVDSVLFPEFTSNLVTSLPDQIFTNSSISPGSRILSSSSNTIMSSIFFIRAASFISSLCFTLASSNSFGHSVQLKRNMPTMRLRK